MIKGIRNILLMSLAVVTGAMSVSAFAGDSNQELVDKMYNKCRDWQESNPGQGTIGSPEPYETDTHKCVKQKCGVSTKGTRVSQESDTEVGLSGGEDPGNQGVTAVVKTTCISKAEIAEAQQRAEDEIWEERRRAEEEERQRRAERERERNRDSGGSSSGSGEYVIRANGAIYTCRDGEQYFECLARLGISFEYDIEFATNGEVDGDGRRVVIVKRRSSGSDRDRRGSGGGSSSSGGRWEIYAGGRTFSCAAGETERECLGADLYSRLILGVDSENCINCRNRRRYESSTAENWNAFANVAGSILNPLAFYKAHRSYAKAQLGSAQARANAQIAGYENCRLDRQDDRSQFYNNIAQNELPNSEYSQISCNGFNTGGFAGGLNNGSLAGRGFWGNTGYSNQFLGLMQGPYGTGYQTGVSVNGLYGNPLAGLGVQGSLGLGIPGLGSGFGLNGGLTVPGYTGGIIGFPSVGGGLQYGGGFGNPNLGGGLQYGGGFGNPNFGGGVQYGGGFGNPNFGGGLQYGGGFGNPNFGGGLQYGGGFGNPNFGGGYASNNGLVPWGNNQFGQYNQGQFGNSQNGANWWSIQQSQQSNMQAQQAGNYYQQAALQNQAQSALYNTSYNGGGFTPAPWSVGGGFSGGFQFGY